MCSVVLVIQTEISFRTCPAQLSLPTHTSLAFTSDTDIRWSLGGALGSCPKSLVCFTLQDEPRCLSSKINKDSLLCCVLSKTHRLSSCLCQWIIKASLAGSPSTMYKTTCFKRRKEHKRSSQSSLHGTDLEKYCSNHTHTFTHSHTYLNRNFGEIFSP